MDLEPPSKRTKLEPTNSVEEEEDESNRRHAYQIQDEIKYGIELYVSDATIGFRGDIKARYSDFVVREIDMDGNVAQLTDLDPPPATSVGLLPPPTTMPSKLVDILPQTQIEMIESVNDGDDTEMQIDVTTMDKDTRTKLHKAISASFAKLDSSTIDKPVGEGQEAKKYIVVRRRDSASRKRDNWPRGRPEYTHFILYKENCDTMDAINLLASSMHTKSSIFSYAGMKDRRAITAQWICCWKTESTRIIAASRRYSHHPTIKVGNFIYKKQPLRLGQLKANKFTIGIRNLKYFPNQNADTLSSLFESIKTRGFINYFGLQRFGTFSSRTDEIGLALLQKKWEYAIELILSYKTASRDHQNDAIIKLWKTTKDPEAVLKQFPRFKFTAQGAMLKSLARPSHRKNFLGAIGALPRNLRTIYVHSYQSLLWNKLATLRIKEFNFQVVPGDLVIDGVNSSDCDLFIEDEPTTDDTSQGSVISGDTETKNRYSGQTKLPVLVVTADNIHKYSIFDVVIPIVGSKVLIPPGPIQDHLELLMRNDGISMDNFKSCDKQFSAYGAYRKLIVKPDSFEWNLKMCTGLSDLVETDIVSVQKDTIHGTANESDDTNIDYTTTDNEQAREAIVLSFSLPPSSYATICLRELMKTSQ